ncbi:hypothetical protein [Maricaulis maris]|uniref:Uncharacterized protein n=1 Tax=Maricaulis maris TaxID=74318 RepID=A0A495D1G0_9PROT|nr:hypothetical protein [Maricaulis maris]RKQ95303.1 hypothetical protein C7435_2993 [Maricaulis maris]
MKTHGRLPPALAHNAARMARRDAALDRKSGRGAPGAGIVKAVAGHVTCPDAPNPVVAWLTGCAATALTGYWAIGVASLAGGETEAVRFLAVLAGALPGALASAALIAFLTAIPMPLLVLAERAAHWRRGASDFLTAALMGAILAQLFGWPMLDGPRGIGLTLFAAFSGGVGGLAYWLAAGRPGHEPSINRPDQGHVEVLARGD